MNREIKFRAWDGEKMVEVGSIDFPSERINYYWGFDKKNESITQASKTGGILLMQFTGLKDKNGKECYEGDIVRYNDLVAEVRFLYGCWHLISQHSKDLLYPMEYGFKIGGSHQGFEIIGNIYQNPELLK